ncbi:uncharacterized protein SPPG_06041 [Spizellomyces punctatus DAOM BR117]|uniref:Peptidase S1 domain-containing protein n=1 Tax=Spizellomyces punctatus (strain DAOM BR117) TaxID=645134 RepID=A0A0L0HDA2_SPIPD|nr:uncharacterized protein SPPG_06041 [Spizellomyces punctatus DAOM BR117]KNC99097.1 hypothetical protein SPPG_06041 [Spizellomyces punctatus DAOM BR117]|eukprot:XP_016607137.1 hypothetical protein SPPG_06041 [Spizellomyces punctatus DAOM BR117]
MRFVNRLPPAFRPVKCISQCRRLTTDYRRLPLVALQEHLMRGAQSCFTFQTATPLASLLDRIEDKHGVVMDRILPYQPTPDQQSTDGVVLIAHVVPDWKGRGPRIGISTGFVILEGGVVVTCCHTFDEIGPVVPPNSKAQSTSVAMTSDGTIYPVQDIKASLPEHDLVVLQLGPPCPDSSVILRPLAVSPYPPPVGTDLKVHIHPDHEWEACKVLMYKNAIGSKAETGTYDDLSVMELNTLIKPGSSGGPVIDEYGAVCGVLRGTVRVPSPMFPKGYSFATPAEKLFEMFKFPVEF